MAIPELQDSKERLTDCIYFGDPISANVGSGFVPQARRVDTTAPLAGGGDLSANRTITIATFAGASAGAVPTSLGGTSNFLRADGTWAAPAGDVPSTRRVDTTAPLAGGGPLSGDLTLSVGTFDGSNDGIVPASGGGTTNFLRADGSWVPAGAPAIPTGEVAWGSGGGLDSDPLFSYIDATDRLWVLKTGVAESTDYSGFYIDPAASAGVSEIRGGTITSGGGGSLISHTTKLSVKGASGVGFLTLTSAATGVGASFQMGTDGGATVFSITEGAGVLDGFTIGYAGGARITALNSGAAVVEVPRASIGADYLAIPAASAGVGKYLRCTAMGPPVNGVAGWASIPASEVVNTPAGGISAVTVQAAINELDTEKASLAGATFTGNVTAPTINASNLTSGRITFATTGGRLTDSSEFTRDATTGNIGIGSGASPGARLLVGGETGAAMVAWGVYSAPTITGAPSGAQAFIGAGITQASTSINTCSSFWSANWTKGGGATITNLVGFYSADMTAGTNNYGFYSAVASGSNKWSVYTGTAQNYFGGNVGVGTTTPMKPLDVRLGASGAEGGGASPAGSAIIGAASSNTILSFGVLNTSYGWMQARKDDAATFYDLALQPSGGAVGIATTTPTSGFKLEVNGKIKASDITLTTGANNGYVLTSDASGNASWQAGTAGMTYLGAWDASTNTPAISDAGGSAGDTYAVSVGGTQNLGSGNVTFVAGGWAIHNGTVWEAIGTSAAVSSVNGLTGAVVLDLATSDFANQGTTTTVLHGNAAGNPSWGAVALATEVSGTLPVANGGTGATTFTTGVAHVNGTSAMAGGLIVNADITTGTIGYDKLAAMTSANLAGIVSDETGSGSLVFSNSPTLVTPTLGAASATSLSLSTALTVANGGTGVTSINGFVKGNGASAFTGASSVALGSEVSGILSVANGGTGLSSLTAGRIPYGAGTGAHGNTDNLFWDSGNNRLGVMTSSPARPLHVNGAGRMVVEDMGGAVWNVLAYDAPYTTGAVVPVSDATSAIQAALNAASAAGGGIVFVPPGNYLIAGYLSVPTACSLIGAMADGKYGTRSTMFYITGDAGNPTATPPVTVWDDATISGIGFIWPNQVTSGTPTAYPFAIRLGPLSRATNLWFDDCYQGIDAGWSSWGFGNAASVYIGWVRGHFLLTGIAIDRSTDFTQVEHVQFLRTGTAGLQAYQAANAEGLVCGRIDSLYASDITALVYKTGIRLAVTANGVTYGTIVNPAMDMCLTGIDIEGTNGPGVTIVGAQISLGSSDGSSYGIYAKTTSGTASNVRVSDSVFWNPYGKPIYSTSAGHFDVDGCSFYGCYSGLYAVDIAAGSCRFTGNTIDPFLGTTLGLRLTASVGRAVVVGNDFGGRTFTNSSALSAVGNNLA